MSFITDEVRQFGKTLVTNLDENPNKLDQLKLFIEDKPIANCNLVFFSMLRVDFSIR